MEGRVNWLTDSLIDLVIHPSILSLTVYTAVNYFFFFLLFLLGGGVVVEWVVVVGLADWLIDWFIDWLSDWVITPQGVLFVYIIQSLKNLQTWEETTYSAGKIRHEHYNTKACVVYGHSHPRVNTRYINSIEGTPWQVHSTIRYDEY